MLKGTQKYSKRFILYMTLGSNPQFDYNNT